MFSGAYKTPSHRTHAQCDRHRDAKAAQVTRDEDGIYGMTFDQQQRTVDTGGQRREEPHRVAAKPEVELGAQRCADPSHRQRRNEIQITTMRCATGQQQPGSPLGNAASVTAK